MKSVEKKNKNGFFSIGKLPQDFLASLLSKINIKDKSINVPPAVGEDAAVIDFGEKLLVLKSDPITFTSENIGYYAVTINSNDLYVMGATPRYFLCTILLPEGITNKKLSEKVFDSILRSCERYSITLCGGHTEITPGLKMPVAAGFMIGEAKKDSLINKKNIKYGDRILLAKGVPIEFTSILADKKKKEIIKKFGESFYKRCKNFTYSPGISIRKAVEIVLSVCKPAGMHDPTEGGLIGGILELSTFIDMGFMIDSEKIRVYEESQILCDYFKFDPLRVIASGGLIIIADEKEASKAKTALLENKIPCAEIGEILKNPLERTILIKGKPQNIIPPVIDEISRLF